MREIRGKIAQRHGITLNDQQIHDLAARRLESILDPRSIDASLLEQLRRGAGARPDTVAAADRASVPFEFEDTTLYDSPSGLTRFLRKLLNPILKLFFNPNPLIRALHIQSRLNVEAARREAERDQRQAEWNALHYEILRRIVSETAKVSLELQSLAHQVESLSAKVDFNERRVRGIEGVMHQVRPGGGRDREREREQREVSAPPAAPSAAAAAAPTEPSAPSAAAGVVPEATAAEAPRRRRRRRRGRRGGGSEVAAAVPSGAVEAGDVLEAEDADESDADFAPGETALDDTAPGDTVTTGTEAIDQLDAAGVRQAGASAPERVTPQLASTEPTAREEAAPELPAPALPDKTES
jgi:hypothetical protein